MPSIGSTSRCDRRTTGSGSSSSRAEGACGRPNEQMFPLWGGPRGEGQSSIPDPPTSDKLVIRGAREHNLWNINVELPRDRLIVLTGLSGSGKSSLAFDTIYAEGQRRYVE